MKKYWKLTTIVVFVVITFTVFYVKNLSAIVSDPTFEVKDIEGDPSIIKNIAIGGSMYDEFGTSDKSFQLYEGKTVYEEEQSLLKRIADNNLSLPLQQYEKDYRSFMRGKLKDDTSFFESDTTIAYAATPFSFIDLDTTSFDIAVLNKETKEENKFSLPIPERGKYWHMTVIDVYYEDGAVFVTTENEKYTDGDESVGEIIVYTFDVETKSLLGQETVAENKEPENANSYTSMETYVDPLKDGLLYIIKSEYRYEDEADDEASYTTDNIVVKEAQVVDIAKQEVTKIPLQADTIHGSIIKIHDGKLYTNEIDKKKIKINEYDLDKGKLKHLDIPVKETSEMWEIYQDIMKIKDDVLYFTADYVEDREAAPIIAIDLNKFKVVYAGEIVANFQNPDETTKQIYFEQLEYIE